MCTSSIYSKSDVQRYSTNTWSWLRYSHHHQSLSHLSRYRLWTSDFHLHLSWAICGSSPQVCLIFSSSLSTQCLHVSSGLPLLLVPSRFHCNVCLVILLPGFRRVCPIQHHLHCLISSCIGLCFYFSHSSPFITFSCHSIFRIFSETSVDERSHFP